MRKQNEWKKLFIALLANGKTMPQVLDLVGEQMKNDMKDSISSNIPPNNSDITIHGGFMRKNGKTIYIKGKGEKKNKTLIDTGQMRQSIHKQVLKKADK